MLNTSLQLSPSDILVITQWLSLILSCIGIKNRLLPHVTYITGTNINYCLTIGYNTFVIIIINHLPGKMVMIERSMHKMTNIVSSHFRYKISICVHVMPKTVTRPCQYQTSPMANHLFFYLGVWSLLVSDISNSQQQPTAGYKEKSKSLPGLSLPTRVKNITNTIPYNANRSQWKSFAVA